MLGHATYLIDLLRDDVAAPLVRRQLQCALKPGNVVPHVQGMAVSVVCAWWWWGAGAPWRATRAKDGREAQVAE